MNKIRLLDIEKNKNCVTYKYECDGIISNALYCQRDFFIEYGFDITDIPNSILVIPFLANLIPIIWICNARIELSEIDKDFLMCLEEVKRSYSEMYPGIEFKGEIAVGKIVFNDIDNVQNKGLLFFSGGVDSFYSLINLHKERPLLCTLWGSDIFLQDKSGWVNVVSQVVETAEEFGLEYMFVKTSFRNILNYDFLNTNFAKPNRENWWHGFQHGIAILAHAAPITYRFGIRRVYLAASVSMKSVEDFTCASTPVIDNNVKFCGCSCIHEGFENSRNDKIRKICNYSEVTNRKITLRVCWEQRNGFNCCVCEKCARTYMAIFAEGFEPEKYGFDLSDEVYRKVRSRIIANELKVPGVFWKDIICGLADKKNLLENNVLADYIVSKYPQYHKSSVKYIPTIVIDDHSVGIDAILLERHHDYSTLSSSFESVGLNSGNQVFREALIQNLSLGKMTYEEYCITPERYAGIPVVVTDLIWINEDSNFDYLHDRVRRFKDIAFVPISVGLQTGSFDTNFKLNSSVQRTLSAIQERAVIGVRGEYTAEILSRHGIKNIEIVGCPSLYYAGTPDFKVDKKVDKICRVSVNFRTFWGLLSREEKHFLTYCANRGYDFIEQTQYEFTPENAADRNYYNYVSKWINSKKKIFFDVSEWKKYLTNFQFSMGLRFHGNVVALWNGIPALFFAIDSRTEEMVRYFELPFIRLRDFDDTKPIEYYYELADYEAFNKGYEQKYLKYRKFLTKNNILKNGK